jgi:hypothetical protein
MLDVMVVVVVMSSLLVLTTPGESSVHVQKVYSDLSERHKEAGTP